MRLGDAQVGTGGKLQPPAQAMAVQHRNHRYRQAGERIKGEVTVAQPMTAEVVRRQAGPAGDVASGAEGLAALAGQDDRADPGAFDLAT